MNIVITVIKLLAIKLIFTAPVSHDTRSKVVAKS